jgi:hypothetical protein
MALLNIHTGLVSILTRQLKRIRRGNEHRKRTDDEQKQTIHV